MSILTDLHSNKGISDQDYKETIEILVNKLKDVRLANTLLTEGVVDIESINSVNDTDIRTILMNTFDEKLDDLVQEIFNSTWGELNKFLSLNLEGTIKLDNLAAVEIAKQNLFRILPQIENRVAALAFYIQDENKKQEILTRFNSMKEEAVNNVLAVENDFKEQIKNQGSLLVASLENLSPVGDKINLLPESVTIISNLDNSSKELWIKAINGEDLDPRTLASDLFGPIVSSATSEVNANIKAYYRDRVSNRKKICNF